MSDIFSRKIIQSLTSVLRRRCLQPGTLERCHVNVIYSAMIEGEKGRKVDIRSARFKWGAINLDLQYPPQKRKLKGKHRMFCLQIHPFVDQASFK